MIHTMTDLDPDVVFQADIAVVGAGLAGVELTQFLARQGLRVVLLESGGLEFDATTQELYRVDQVGLRMRTPETHGHMTPYLLPMYRGNNRIRQYGGTGNAWTGKWRIQYVGLRATPVDPAQRMAAAPFAVAAVARGDCP